jgi:hypothetical protein
METIDLGLSKEEELNNNKSTRDPINFHQQRSSGKPKGQLSRNNHQELEEQKTREETDKDNHESDHSSVEGDTKRRKIDEETNAVQSKSTNVSQTTGHYSTHVARPVLTMKGHTAFLTFAIRSLTD